MDNLIYLKVLNLVIVLLKWKNKGPNGKSEPSLMISWSAGFSYPVTVTTSKDGQIGGNV